MLLKLLRLIASVGSADHAELARALGVTPALIDEMLNTLSRQGYLKRVVDEPPAFCGQCPLRRECLSVGKPRLWILSEKGEKALARHQA